MGKIFVCPKCRRSFSKKFNYTRHLKTHNRRKEFKCTICDSAFDSISRLISHSVEHGREGIQRLECPGCPDQRTFKNRESLAQHRRVFHKQGAPEPKRGGIKRPIRSPAVSIPTPAPPTKAKSNEAKTSRKPEHPKSPPIELRIRNLPSDSETDNTHSEDSTGGPPTPAKKNKKSKRMSDGVPPWKPVQTNSDSDFSDPERAGYSGDRDRRLEQRRSLSVKKKKKKKRRRLFKPDDLCEVVHTGRKWARSLKTHVDKYKVKLKEDMKSQCVEELLEKLRIVLKQVLREMKANSFENSFARLVIEAEGIWTPVSLTFRALDDINPDQILDRLSEILQSDESLDFSTCCITAICTRLPVARGLDLPDPYSVRRCMSEDRYIRLKRAIFNPYRKDANREQDSLCFPRCIALGKKLLQNPGIVSKTLQKLINKSLVNEAAKLARQVGQGPREGAKYEHWVKYQELLEGEQLVVWGNSSPRPLYHGPYRQKQIHLYVNSDQSHCYFVTSIKALLGVRGFCSKCLRGTDPRRTHRCEQSRCPFCKVSECKNNGKVLGRFNCPDCNLDFASTGCLEIHKTARTCQLFAKCRICWRSVKRKQLEPPERHHCMEQYCRYCRAFTYPGHRCFMTQKPEFGKPDKCDRHGGAEDMDSIEEPESEVEKMKKKKGRRDVLNVRTLFGDFEAKIDPESLEHTPVLLVVQDEKGESWEWEGEGCAAVFLQEMGKNPKLRQSTVVFQNGSGYDFIFILSAVLKTMHKKPRIIKRASRILCIDVPGAGRFVDSIAFAPVALRNYPRVFGLDQEIRKGFFPYKYASFISDDYRENHLPPIEAFETQYCSPKESEELMKWYSQEASLFKADPDKVYDLRDEMKQYCRSDCTILRLGFLKLIEMYKKTYFIHPLTHISAPSALNSVFLGQYLKNSLIPLTPERGFTRKLRRHYSVAEVCWLEGKNILEDRQIQHSRNSLPAMIGCVYHGHRSCMRKNSSPGWKKLMKQRRVKTSERLKFFRGHGYSVESIYGCQYRKEWQSDPERHSLHQELYKFFKETMDSPLNPRDSLRGGRVNVVRCKAEATETEKIVYADFNSLYPATNFCVDDDMAYPSGGWPKISFLNYHNVDLNNLNGLIKCSVLVPPDLHLGPLPFYCDGKLSFPLCRTCTIKKTSKCVCTEAERAFSGTFCGPEVKLGLRLGVRFFNISEIWQFPNKSRDLFRDFIANAYKSKLESSFKKHWTDEQRQRVFEDALKIGITLDPAKCIDNVGLRSFCKFILNQFWGYLSLSAVQTVDTFISEWEEYFPLLLDPKVNVKEIEIVDDNMIWVSYDKDEIAHKPNVQVILGAYTTSQARVKLYNALEKFGTKLCYFDTDSLICMVPREEPFPLPLGDALGCLKDDIDVYGNDFEIDQFYGIASKCYSCRVIHKKSREIRDYIVRAKGVSLSSMNKDVLTHTNFSDLVQFNIDHKGDGTDGQADNLLYTHQFNIRRDPKKQILRSVYLQKRIRPISKGRYLSDSDGLTRPFGYKDSNEDAMDTTE